MSTAGEQTSVWHAVFIEPEGALREWILRAKDVMRKAYPTAVYVDHPPHSTVLLAPVADSAGMVAAIRTAAAKVRGFECRADGVAVFRNDSLAGGGHTVYAKLAVSPEVRALQRALALESARVVDRSRITEAPIAWPPVMRESQAKYGWPFVGEHWIPHFTVGAAPVDDPAGVVGQLLGWEMKERVEVREVAVWRVEGERHERVEGVRLG